MLSRVANSIYWISRYVERAENYSRFVSVNLNLALDAPGILTEQWEPLLIATADNEGFYKFNSRANRNNVIDYMTFDKRNPNSIYSCLAAARENARTIRESITKEMWEHINMFYLKIKETQSAKNWDVEQLQQFFTEIKDGCQLYWGIVDATVTRNEAFHFGRMGRFLERGDKTSRFLDVRYFTLLPDNEAFGSPQELLIWTSVLKSVGAFNMYRQEHRVINPSHIVEFLILDKSFPRSVFYCVRQAELSLYEISGHKMTEGYSNPAEKTLSKLRHEIEFTEVDDIFEKALHPYLDEFQIKNNSVAKTIFDTYFGLKPVEQ
jgi:uncharacterized alpha-E superfamily protein